jgi:hypothetical protein
VKYNSKTAIFADLRELQTRNIAVYWRKIAW